jgi:hypothetical protein
MTNLKGNTRKSIFIFITLLTAFLSFLTAFLLLPPPPACPPFLFTPSLRNIVGGDRGAREEGREGKRGRYERELLRKKKIY